MGRITHKIIDAGKYVRYVPGSKVQAFRKLGQLEDLMEKHGIDDFETLDIVLGCAIKNQEKIIELSADLGMYQNENAKLTEDIEKYWKLEEELGCRLEVVFKAMKYGIEFEHKLTNEKLISKYIRVFYSQKNGKLELTLKHIIYQIIFLIEI